MPSAATVQQASSSEENYGLDAIAEHNAALASTERIAAYQNDRKALSIYDDGYTPYADPHIFQSPPTPRSTTVSEGMRTRSGRSTRGRTDSPFDNGRVSKSPATRTRKDRKPKLDKSKTPKLTAPLSVLTKDLNVPLKDMDEWVNRSAETRRAEVEKRNGYVARPMNSFMLYRSCYADRTKAWCVQNNHQVVSSVSGESWPMEPQEVRQQFEEWARIERANHAKAHPEYKFSPSKSNKRRKDDFSDDEGDDASDLDADPDGEYRGTRTKRRTGQAQHHQQAESLPLNNTYGFDSHPYYGQQIHSEYEHRQYQLASPGRPVPSNTAYDVNGLIYNPQTQQYIQTATYTYPQYAYAQDMSEARVQTPQHQRHFQQSVGGYGLPSGQQIELEDLFSGSRTATPMRNYYSQPMYGEYLATHATHTYAPAAYLPSSLPSTQEAYLEHQAYLEKAAQPQAAIDPSLDADFGKTMAVDHFENAMAEITTEELANLNFYPETTSPMNNVTGTVSTWNTGEMMQ